jgi:hypothetical protein
MSEMEDLLSFELDIDYFFMQSTYKNYNSYHKNNKTPPFFKYTHQNK